MWRAPIYTVEGCWQMVGQWLFGSARPTGGNPDASSLISAPATSVLPQPGLTCLLAEDSPDARARRLAQVAQDELGGIHIVVSEIAGLSRHANLLESGGCLPIGTPAFVRACAAHAGLAVREWSCYPKGMRDHMRHHPRKVAARFALSRSAAVFIKPVKHHAFRGFVMRPNVDAMLDSEREQFEILLDLAPSTPVWMAQALSIASEWRYYIHEGALVGFGPTQPPGSYWPTPPAPEALSEMLLALPKRISCALDLAVLSDGRTTLLTVRDPLHLDLLPFGEDRPRAVDFVRLRFARWSALMRKQRETGGRQASS